MRLKKMSDYILKLVEAPPGERSERDINAILPVLALKAGCFRSLDKGKVSVYLDVKRDEKTIITDDNPLFPLPPHRKLSFMTDTDKDGGSDKQSDIHSATGSRRDIYSSKSKREKSSRSVRELVHFASSRPPSKTTRIESKRRTSIFAKENVKDDKRGRKKLGVCVNKLTQFQWFGELALIYPNRQRNASAIAEETTDVLAISYEVFEKTLQDIMEQDLDEKRLFIQTHPFFSKWNAQMQRQLQWSLVRTDYKTGDHMIKQGDTVNGLNFLVSGRARVAAEPVRHRILFPDLFVKPKKSVFEKEEPDQVHREDTSLAEIALVLHVCIL
ncbi:hypothetical protein ACF0H5_018793 [Mactra antiquata]